jgi:pyruvate dehydrogenase E1 component
MAVIIQDGLRRMYEDQEDVFYYITAMNENHLHPALPAGVETDIIKGMYLFKAGEETRGLRVQLLGSGVIFLEIVAAAELLKDDWGIASDLWSCPSFTELAREAYSCERWNRLHPEQEKRHSHVAQCLEGRAGPVIASTDYMRSFAEQITPYVSGSYTVLGTDGFGRSDTREKLRHFFEVDRYFITITALKSLMDQGEINVNIVTEALAKYGIDTDLDDPRLR